jgi:hypothetical protein
VLFALETESLTLCIEAAVKSRADLFGADLSGANLSGATNIDNLPQEWVRQCSRDMLFVFLHTKVELPYLRQALIDGKVNGTQYEGDCSCLIGTLGKADGGLDKLCEMIPYYQRGLHNHSEQWFWQIREGDTPETSIFSAHALKLIDEVNPQFVRAIP